MGKPRSGREDGKLGEQKGGKNNNDREVLGWRCQGHALVPGLWLCSGQRSEVYDFV